MTNDVENSASSAHFSPINSGGMNDESSASAGVEDQTPLSVLGARRSVEIARRARGGRLAETELQQAEYKLAELEQVWPQRLQDEGAYVELAREVMRLAERARSLAVERASRKGGG